MLREFFAYYRPHRRLFLIDFSCAVISGLLELAFPLAVMTFLGSFGLMFTLNPTLALITGLVVPPMTWVSTRYGRAMTLNMRALFGRIGDFNARIEENVGGMRVVQAFANEDHERKLFAKDNEAYRDTKLDAYRLMSKSMSLSYMTMRIVQLFVMIAGAFYVLRGELTVGGFMGFLLLVNVFFRPVEKINAVLDNINLTIYPGETVAFVGPSGAGKTTICSLVPRFYEPLSGGQK